MIKIKQFQLRVILDKEDCRKLVKDLSEKYHLLLYNMKKEYIKKMDLKMRDPEEWAVDSVLPADSQLLGGDMVYLPPGGVMYYKVPVSADIIEIGVIGKDLDKKFEKFAVDIKESIMDALESPDDPWIPGKKLGKAFLDLLKKGKNIKPHQKDVDAANILLNEQYRHLMKVIREKDSIFLDKLTQEVSMDNLEDTVKEFNKLDLVNSDFALICGKTGQQILRIPDENALVEISEKGFKCFICGASIADERLVRAISMSDFGNKVMEQDYWFLAMVVDTLRQLEIPFEDIFVLQLDAPDMQVLLNNNNEAVLMQLTNKKLTLEDAFLLSAYISAYKIDHLIVVSTGEISQLMKSHLQDTNSKCSISFIEGLENLKNEIMNIFINMEKKRLLSILDHLSEITPVPIEELVTKKVLPQEEKESDNDEYGDSGDVEDEIIDEMGDEDFLEDLENA